jgi:hypothetical protein
MPRSASDWQVVGIPVAVAFLLVAALVGRIPPYTLSLAIWAIPVLAMTLFLHRRKRLSPEVRSALWIALGTTFALGSVLDLLFGNFFFLFPNPQAVLGWRLRGIPVEEFGFYLLGGWCVTLGYIFCDQWWLSRYQRSPKNGHRRWPGRIPAILIPSLGQAAGFALLAFAGIGAKHWLNPGGDPIPGYFLFLVGFAYLPSFLLGRITAPFLNARALAMTLSVIVGFSLVWEATLALPGGWWGYREPDMIGIFIAPWHRLPLEAVTVWFYSAQAILVYETVRILLSRQTPPGNGGFSRRSLNTPSVSRFAQGLLQRPIEVRGSEWLSQEYPDAQLADLLERT